MITVVGMPMCIMQFYAPVSPTYAIIHLSRIENATINFMFYVALLSALVPFLGTENYWWYYYPI